MGRAIGRICGKDGELPYFWVEVLGLLITITGKTKFAIENASKVKLNSQLNNFMANLT